MSAPRQWCPDCRSRNTVVDQFTESHYEPTGEMGYRVTELSCGHYLETTPVKVGPAPGAPTVAGALPNLAALMRPEAWEVPA